MVFFQCDRIHQKIIKSKEFSDAGSIISIELMNFMNHSHYTLNLCPKINFISGKNGSGKSVFSAALQVIFGGTAKETGRAPVLEKLIQHGHKYVIVPTCIHFVFIFQ